MPASNVIASRGTGLITSSRRVMDVPSEIFLLQPDAAPLVQILFKAKKKPCINPKFTHYERDLFPKRDKSVTTPTISDSQTTFEVDNVEFFQKWDVIKNEETDEQMLVTDINGSELTVKRGWGTSAADSITVEDNILILGNANEEGAGAPGIKTEKATELYNYTQDFRSPFEVTDILNNSELYGGGDLQNERVIKLIEHKVDMERAFLFGERKEEVIGTHPTRATAGALSRISSNVATMTTATEAAFETFCEDVFSYGSSTKLFLGSAKWVSALNFWGRKALNTVPKDKTYGISIKEYLTGHGTLLLAKHRLLTGAYSGMGIVLDMDKIWVRVLKNMDTKLRTNIQANDETKQKDEYETVAGLMLTNEACHAVVNGMEGFE